MLIPAVVADVLRPLVSKLPVGKEIATGLEIAYILLHTLRDRRPVCVSEIYWATYCISPRVTSLLRSFRAANRYSHFHTAYASLRAHTCCRR